MGKRKKSDRVKRQEDRLRKQNLREKSNQTNTTQFPKQSEIYQHISFVDRNQSENSDKAESESGIDVGIGKRSSSKQKSESDSDISITKLSFPKQKVTNNPSSKPPTRNSASQFVSVLDSEIPKQLRAIYIGTSKGLKKYVDENDSDISASVSKQCSSKQNVSLAEYIENDSDISVSVSRQCSSKCVGKGDKATNDSDISTSVSNQCSSKHVGKGEKTKRYSDISTSDSKLCSSKRINKDNDIENDSDIFVSLSKQCSSKRVSKRNKAKNDSDISTGVSKQCLSISICKDNDIENDSDISSSIRKQYSLKYVSKGDKAKNDSDIFASVSNQCSSKSVSKGDKAKNDCDISTSVSKQCSLKSVSKDNDIEKNDSDISTSVSKQYSSKNISKADDIEKNDSDISANVSNQSKQKLKKMQDLGSLDKLNSTREAYLEKRRLAYRKRYREDKNFKEKKKAAVKEKYQESINKSAKIQAGITKYASNPQHKESLKMASKRKYAGDLQHKECKKSASKKKYAQDLQHKESVKSYSKLKYAEDFQHRELVKMASKRKYATDINFRESLIGNKKKKYNINEQYKESVRAYERSKYRKSNEHREHKLSQQSEKYKHNEELRQRMILSVTQTRAQSRKTDDIVALFKNEINKKPKYVCCVCHKFLWRDQCLICHPEDYIQKATDSGTMAENCITYKYQHVCTQDCEEFCEVALSYRGKLWICFTCHRKLLKGEMPPEAQCNGLELPEIPEQLKNVNDLERHLLALRLPFMKMVSLPKGGQKGVIGPCVSVPTDIQKTTKTLPRTDDDAQLIRVKLKRKMPYKGHYKYQFVNTKRLKVALDYLKEHNKWYNDVKVDTEWENPVPNVPESDDINDSTDDETGEENQEIKQTVTGEGKQEIKQTVADEGKQEFEQTDTDNERMQGVPVDTCLQHDDIGQEVLDQYFDDIFCIAPAENNTPVSMLREVGNEAMSFPCLFPDGSASFSDNRPVSLTPLRYFHNRLMNADSRFASDTSYIFYAQYMSELQQVISGVSIALRKGTPADQSGRKISSNMITDKDKLKTLLSADQGYKFLKPVRGTPPYWQSTMKDLFAMIRQKGIPTWFCSFSAADMRWTEIINTILEQQGSSQTAEELDWAQKCQVLSNNPVMNAIMFNHRFSSFLKLVILSEQQPIGKIDNRFHRVEFQKRGSPHTHCIFWVKDSPQLDKEDDDTICNFIDKYVVCRLPAEEEDSDLHEIVSSVQRHSSTHSKSCKKKGTSCRFHFPRPPSERTFISRPISFTDPSSDKSAEQELNEAKKILQTLWDIILNPDIDPADITTTNLFLQAGITQEQYEHASDVMTKRASIVLQRSPADVWINQYNPTLLKCWNANMDIQFILDAYSCVMYVISYISKAERELGLILEETRKEAVEGNLDAEQAMKKIGSSYFHQREVCVQEAVYHVCGLHLKECSCKIQFVPVGENPIRMSKPLNLIQGKSHSDHEEDIWMSSLLDKYKARPAGTKFDNLCYASFCSEFRILSPSQIPKKPSTTVYELQNNFGHIQQRTRTQAAVVRYPRFSAEKTPEMYYQSILQLFLPYRTDDQLKPKPFDTYEEFYKSGMIKLTATSPLVSVSSIVDENQALFEKDAQVLDEAKELMEKCGPLEDAWASLASETEKERQECEMEMNNKDRYEEEEHDEVPELSDQRKERGDIEIVKTRFKTHDMLPLMRCMNAKQKEVFYYVREWCINKINGKDPNPFHLFITGGAGTGKSHLVKCLYFEVQRLLSPSTPNPDDIVALLTAPTGTAAFNIGGTTIHSAFSLSKCLALPYRSLKDESINTLRSKLQYLQVLFIDEISMVDQKLLIYVSERLRQIKVTKSSQVPFGNISVIAVGDFYQLPPVRQATLLKKNPKYPLNLFTDFFQLVELSEIMRQKDDAEFANMLNRFRIRTKKDPISQCDIDRLEKCHQNYEQTESLHVFSTNAEVDAHNYHMARKVCDVAMAIFAKDFQKNLTTGKLQSVDRDYNISHNCLPTELFIGKGARVMLIRNLDITDGLVNGVFGTVKDILPPKDESSLQQGILVKFDNESVGLNLRNSNKLHHSLSDLVMIKPITEDIGTHGRVRTQFPLQLAWACTVHKVQGTTTDAITTSFSKIFSPGQAYVALSRCRSMKGLMIKDLDINKIYCDENVATALEKMHRFEANARQNVPPNSVSLLLHNIQGLYSHFQDLMSNLDVLDADYICLTETWLKSADIPSSFSDFIFQHVSRLSSYDTSSEIFAGLKRQLHGGVGVFFRKTAGYSSVDFGVLNIEYMAFQIHKYDVIVILIYRPESYPSAEFKKNLSALIEEVHKRKMKALLLGDFNENLLQPSNPIHTFLQQRRYKQLVSKATTDGGTLLDHVYSNADLQIDINIVPTYYSYHNMVSVNLSQVGL